eukprot:6563599-Pyramimonas_sp.AAC.1
MKRSLQHASLEHLLEVARCAVRELVVGGIVAPPKIWCRHACQGERRASTGVHLVQPGPIFWKRICTPTRPIHTKAGLVTPVLVIAVGALPLRVVPARGVRGMLPRGHFQHQEPMPSVQRAHCMWRTMPSHLACADV